MSPNNVSTTNLCHEKSTKRLRTKVNGREPRIHLTPRCAEPSLSTHMRAWLQDRRADTRVAVTES